MRYRTAFYYDERSNLTRVLNPEDGLTYYAYDAENRVTSVTSPWGEVTSYEYSPGGRVLARHLPNGCATYYSYDAVGQVSLVDNRAPRQGFPTDRLRQVMRTADKSISRAGC